MSEKRFSKKEAISFGWKTVNDNLGFFIVLGLIFVALNIPSFFAEAIKETMPVVAGFINIVSAIISLLLAPGIIKIYLDFCDGKQGRLGDLLAYPHLFFRYLGAVILYALAIMGVGFITVVPIILLGVLGAKMFQSTPAEMRIVVVLLITVVILLALIPAMIMSVKLQFFSYFLVDKNTGAIESLKKSYALTKGLWGELFVFGLLLFLVNVAGFLCLLIGLLATIPMTYMAMAYVYRKLVSQEQLIPVRAKLIE